MIKRFVEKISMCNSFCNVENQYSSNFIHADITKNNLKKYLEIMYQLKPTTIMIGEAPGYNGCRWSGIPFTAEKNIKFEYINKCLFGIENGFMIRNYKKPQAESSATIVWDYLYSRQIYPLIWNAFPFHPYKNNYFESNRTPNNMELQYGEEVLKELLSIFRIDQIISVGNTAYKALKKMGIESDKVRHPANAGKAEFIKGMNLVLKNHPTTAST